ncbi:MAG TPA: hypothetical protein VHU19_06665 [Pyrinomonadaceae bacterium]|nr:hypothetical protein [Pyrinomonadaceae bacterium]
MKLKKLCPTFILTLMLTTSAFAGTMECGEIAPPTAPASATAQSNNIEPLSISSSATVAETSAADVSVAEAALGLVGTVLALF